MVWGLFLWRLALELAVCTVDHVLPSFVFLSVPLSENGADDSVFIDHKSR